jgi:hypothetical protein
MVGARMIAIVYTVNDEYRYYEINEIQIRGDYLYLVSSISNMNLRLDMPRILKIELVHGYEEK